MSIPRYCTVGAVARDLGALKALDERLEALGVEPGSMIVLSRRRDERLVGVTLPGIRTRRVESGLSRMQWFEFASAFLGVTAVSVLMGAVHLTTGVIVQSLLTLAAVVCLVLYHRRPRLERKLLSLGLPENLAEEWAGAFADGFALALVTVPAELFDETQEAFLGDGLEAPLAVDRRPVL
jgi:Fe2+ transport system protein FeoA